MAKKVFYRIFTTIQIVVNAIFGGICGTAAIVFTFVNSNQVQLDEDTFTWALGMLIVFNVVNAYIRRLVNNY